LTEAISARYTIILQIKTKTEFYAISAKVTQPQRLGLAEQCMMQVAMQRKRMCNKKETNLEMTYFLTHQKRF